MTGNGVIALGDSLALVPWYLRVNLGTDDTSVLVPSPEEALKKVSLIA